MDKVKNIPTKNHNKQRAWFTKKKEKKYTHISLKLQNKRENAITKSKYSLSK